MSLMRTLVLFLLGLSTVITPVQAGNDSDKGTVGIVCRIGGKSFEIDQSLEGKRREQAILEFRACVDKVLDGQSEDKFRINSAMMEENRKSTGIDDLNISGYSVYWDVLRTCTKTKKKAGEALKKAAPRIQNQSTPDAGSR